MKFDENPSGGICFDTCEKRDGHEEGSSFFSRLNAKAPKTCIFCFNFTGVKCGTLTPEKEISKMPIR